MVAEGDAANQPACSAFVFGYGSLVSPASLGRTLERVPTMGIDMFPATLTGYQRSWNYAISRARGRSADGRLWTLVALGLVANSTAWTNGVIAAVDGADLTRLDRRESRYDRVDVTEFVSAETQLGAGATVVTYVPRSVAIEAMRTAAEAGEAAIERRYWDLVIGAFDDLGQRDEFVSTTPTCDLPVLELERV